MLYDSDADATATAPVYFCQKTKYPHLQPLKDPPWNRHSSHIV